MFGTVFALLAALFTSFRKRHTEECEETEMAVVVSAKRRKGPRQKLSTERRRLRDLAYLADRLLRFHYENPKTLEGFVNVAGGNRVRRMLRALKVLYPYRSTFGSRLKSQLRALLFAQKLDRRNERLKNQAKPVLGLAGRTSLGVAPPTSKGRSARRLRVKWV